MSFWGKKAREGTPGVLRSRFLMFFCVFSKVFGGFLCFFPRFLVVFSVSFQGFWWFLVFLSKVFGGF